MDGARLTLATAMLALLLTGCPRIISSEGDSCDDTQECGNPSVDLVCFYGTCRLACTDDTGCSAGQRCTCDASWAPYDSAAFAGGSHFGVCAPTCGSDADCGPLLRCTAEQKGDVCASAPSFCAHDGFCHLRCATEHDGCNVIVIGENGVAADQCMNVGDAGLICDTEPGFACPVK